MERCSYVEYEKKMVYLVANKDEGITMECGEANPSNGKKGETRSDKTVAARVCKNWTKTQMKPATKHELGHKLNTMDTEIELCKG